jgi:hypothetical protein
VEDAHRTISPVLQSLSHSRREPSEDLSAEIMIFLGVEEDRYGVMISELEDLQHRRDSLKQGEISSRMIRDELSREVLILKEKRINAMYHAAGDLILFNRFPSSPIPSLPRLVYVLFKLQWSRDRHSQFKLIHRLAALLAHPILETPPMTTSTVCSDSQSIMLLPPVRPKEVNVRQFFKFYSKLS